MKRVALAIVACIAGPLSADLVLQCNLVRLHKNAGAIVHGRCVAKTSHSDAEPWPYVEYTFEIIEAVKGCRDEHDRPLRKLTFRHVADRPARRLPNGTVAAARRFGVPEYEVGDERLLFLTRESRRGLCAPVGLEQGSFKIERSRQRNVVRNRLKNRGLLDRIGEASFRDLPAGTLRKAREAQDALELDTLLELCRRLRS